MVTEKIFFPRSPNANAVLPKNVAPMATLARSAPGNSGGVFFEK
jgi:hypothetical protein